MSNVESRLPIGKALEYATFNGKHAVLLNMESLAGWGGSCLVGLILDRPYSEMGQHIQGGVKFLDRVLKDIEYYTQGIDVNTGEIVYYNPREVFKIFAEICGAGEGVSEEEKIQIGIKGMSEYVAQFKDLFSQISNGNVPSHDELGKTLHGWRELSAPYQRMSHDVHWEWMRGHQPPNLADLSRMLHG